MRVDTSGFYKVVGKNMIFAKDFVRTQEYELEREKATHYVYPVDGWHFFWSHTEAAAYFAKKGDTI